MKTHIGASLLAVAMLTAGGAYAAPPAHIEAALADKARPAADAARDGARKAGDLLAFAEVKPGQKVVDFIAGGGYFTRILSPAVGPKGHVWIYQPAEFHRFSTAYTKVAADYQNVTPKGESLTALDLPDGLDLIFTVQNYHDLHLSMMPADNYTKVNAELFKSLKPGGLLIVVDHAGEAGAGAQAANTVHRFDQAIARKELEAAGFQFVAESDLLKNPADPKTANVFDPAIRGKTDQWIMKFRKP